MGTLIQDLRYGLRGMRRSLLVTLVAVAALALGIGANSAIFSVVNAVLLRPLPYERPEQLVTIRGRGERDGSVAAEQSYPNFLDLRGQCSSCEGAAAYSFATTFLMNPGQEPERVRGLQATADLLPLLGAKPLLGRPFTAEEDQPGARRVVVLSHGFWQRAFGGDPRIVGRDVPLGSSPVTVVGVMPEGFKFPVQAQQVDFWMPLLPSMSQGDREGRGSVWLDIVARLKPGVTAEQAQGEIYAISKRLQAQYPATNTGYVFFAKPLHEDLVGDLRPALLVLLAAVGCVLLIACANVANLLLARAASRHKEMSIRAALGASRWRIVRQLLTESVLLSAAGGAAGLLLAVWGLALLTSAAPASIPRMGEVALDARVVLFTAAVSLLTGVVFGLAPALHASRADVGEALKEGGRGMTGGRSRLRSGLVVAEVALSLVLLVAAGLLSQSFRRLLDVRPGFDPEGVVALDVVPRSALYPKPEQRVQFFRGFLEQSERVPGVEAVGLVDPLPLGGNFEAWDFEIEGRPPAAPGEPRTADRRIVSPDYFRAMRVPLLRGRAFTRDDRADSTKVVVVNEALARQFFPGEDALGKRLVIGDRATGTREIVGVVGDVRHAGLDEKTTPELYIPFTQATPGRLTVVARSPDPGAAADALRAVIRQSDRESPIYNVRTMDQLLSTSVARRRFNMILLGGFAAVALLLAALGIYGVVSYTVAQRTHEIGLRVALGARPRDVLSLVIRQGMTPALAGVGVGLCAALAVTRVMAGLLFNVSATDPATFALIPLLLAAVALLACYVPARRASRVDPLVALRHE